MWWLRKKNGTRLSLPSGETVRVHIDPDVDAATIVLSDEPVARTERIPGFGLVDVDEDGNVVAIELLNVSKQIEELKRAREQTVRRDLADDLQAWASHLVSEARESVKV